jgi:arabinogalactan endo-1,4-beta-galactosidase
MTFRRSAPWASGILVLAGILAVYAPAQQTQPTAGGPPATQPQTARGRGRAFGQGRRPTTLPGMVRGDDGTWFTPMRHTEYAFGVDVSSIMQLELNGMVFKENSQPKPALQIFREHGYNWVRLRVCHEPARLPQTTAYTIAAAKLAKKMGFKFLLDFHYSDSWADPTGEPTPPEWQRLSHAELVSAVFEYTRETIAAMQREGVLPDMIQVGNEIGNGMLWPSGKLPAKWDDFADLVYAGVNGIDAGRGNGIRPKIMIHVDHGGDIDKTRAFFDKLTSYDVPFDVIGFSFYPWSHGSLLDLRANLNFAASTYNKDVFVVETGYYYQPSRYFRDLPGPFPETPDGQAQWLAAVNQAVMDVPNSHGKGVFWWEPASNGGLAARGYFDADGNVQPIINVFNQFTRPLHRTDGQ